jgi:hypothetical protein
MNSRLSNQGLNASIHEGKYDVHAILEIVNTLAAHHIFMVPTFEHEADFKENLTFFFKIGNLTLHHFHSVFLLILFVSDLFNFTKRTTA